MWGDAYYSPSMAKFPKHGPRGRHNPLLITGNISGRADAGRIWQARFNGLRIHCGLCQLVADRRAWVMNTQSRKCQRPSARARGGRGGSWDGGRGEVRGVAWALMFNAAAESAELSAESAEIS